MFWLCVLVFVLVMRVGLLELPPGSRRHALKYLRNLDISMNYIKRLPEDLWSYLIDLQELNVSHNPLEELPAEMFTANIVKLVANSCPFKELPSFGEGCVLEELFLENGSCEIIPGTIGRVLRLKTLKLAGSQVQHIPKTAVFCKELVTFDMGGRVMVKGTTM